MGLTNIQRGLIRAIVSDNKTPDSVKSMALLVLREDTTAKNKAFCQHAITLLEKKKGIADQEMNRVVITILQELDQVDSKMIIVAATNRFDMLDNAIIRRFSVHHEVQRLSLEESRMMIRNYIHDLPINIDDIEVDRVIEMFNGKDVAQSYLINALTERIAEILFKRV